MYADYAFYQEVYQGEAVPAESYPRIAARASRCLDGLTFGRIDRVYAGCADVKMACCQMADVLWEQEEAQEEVARERLDAYEVAYVQREMASLKKRLTDAAQTHLWRTGLLSLAVMRDG